MKSNTISAKLKKRIAYCRDRKACRASKRYARHHIRQELKKQLNEEISDYLVVFWG